MAEFAYNSLVNRSTGSSPFERVTGYKSRKPIGLPLPIDDRPSASIESCAQHLHDLHDGIRWQMAVNNANCKFAANLHKRF